MESGKHYKLGPLFFRESASTPQGKVYTNLYKQSPFDWLFILFLFSVSFLSLP